MNLVEYIMGDIVGIVVGLCIYDWLVSVRWIKLAKRNWKFLSVQLVGLFKRKKKRVRRAKSVASKGDQSDIY